MEKNPISEKELKNLVIDQIKQLENSITVLDGYEKLTSQLMEFNGNNLLYVICIVNMILSLTAIAISIF